MGDLSAEPSMEDILSSIKRIIAEEGDTPQRPRRTPSRPVAVAPVEDDDDPRGGDTIDEVLELSDPMPPRTPKAQALPPRAAPTPPASPPVPPAVEEPRVRIASEQAAQATRGAFDTLSRLMVKPEPSSDGTLEGLVREMLRPMLAEWIDANLPAMVEAMVAREIARITGEAG